MDMWMLFPIYSQIIKGVSPLLPVLHLHSQRAYVRTHLLVRQQRQTESSLTKYRFKVSTLTPCYFKQHTHVTILLAECWGLYWKFIISEFVWGEKKTLQKLASSQLSYHELLSCGLHLLAIMLQVTLSEQQTKYI